MKKVIEPGNYYIIDPIYDLKKQFVDDIYSNFRYGQKSFAYNIVASKNKNYRDNKGNTYKINSGLLGIFPISMCKSKIKRKSYNFNKEVIFEINEGVFRIIKDSQNILIIDTTIQ